MSERRTTTRKAKTTGTTKTAAQSKAKTATRSSSKTTAPRKPRATKSRKPDCMVVLGMHRSGTSALSGVLGILGCDQSETQIPANPTNEKGHFESVKIRALLDDMLSSAASSWDDWLPLPGGWFDSGRAEAFEAEAVDLLRDEFGASKLFVLKNPRISRLVPLWDRVWAQAGVEPRFVLIHRNPLEVAASLERRNNIDMQLGLLIWLRHVLDAEAGTRGRPRSFVSYSGLLQNWLRTAETLQSDLGVSLPRLSLGVTAEVEAFLSPALRHFNETAESVLNNPVMSSWTKDVYAILERWADNGEDPADHAQLDDMRHLFDSAAPAFARIVQHGREMSDAVAHVEQDLNAKAQAQASLQSALSQTEERFKRVRQERDDTAQTAAQLQQEHTALQKSAAALAAQLDALNTKLAEADRNQKQYVFEAEEAAHQREALRRDKAQAEAAHKTHEAELRKQLDATRTQAEAATQALDTLRTEKAQAEAAHKTHEAELRKQLDATRTQTEAATQALDTLRREKAQAEQALAESRAAAETRAQELRDTLEETQAMLTQREQELDKAGQEAQDRMSALEAAREENQDMHQELENSRTRLADLRTQLEQSQHQLDQSTQELAARAEENAALEEARDALLGERDQAREAQAETETEVLSLRSELEASRDALETSEAACDALNQKLSIRHDELLIVTRNFMALEEQIAALKDDVQAGQDALQASARDAAATLADKQQELDAQLQALQALQDELAQTQSAMRQRAHEADETANALRSAEGKLNEYESWNKQLEQDVAHQEARVAELLHDMAAVRDKAQQEQRQRFDEVAHLTQQIIEREGAFEAHQAHLQNEVATLKAHVAERDAALASETAALEAERKVSEDLAGQRALLLPRLENSEGLADQLTEVLRTIVDGNAVVKGPVRALSERRKARLLLQLGLFDPKWYHQINNDVREAGKDPTLHFIRYGFSEGRAATPEMAVLMARKKAD